MIILALAAGLALAGTASARTPVGIRAGYTDWDGLSQAHFGAHLKVGELFPNVDLTPGLEFGFSGGATVATLNGDLAYKFTELVEAPWGFYAGGSLSLNYLKPDAFDSDLKVGLSGLIGGSHLLNNGDQILLEVRLGILDSPDFKITAGYTFF